MAEDDEFEFDRLSWIDPAGRIFWRDGNLYRGIRPLRAKMYRDLIAAGVIQRLVDSKMLIDSWVADFSSEEFPLVLQHRVLPVVSYPSEWCGSQLKAAALMVLDLEIALRKDGLTLNDVNPWNVLFDGPTPLFVDFSAIAPLEDAGHWEALQLFNEFFLNPLALFERGLERVARPMLFDPWTGVTDYDLDRIRTFAGEVLTGRQFAYRALRRMAKAPVPTRVRPALKKGLQSIVAAARGGARQEARPDGMELILRLRERVAGMAIEERRSGWRAYYDANFPEFAPSEHWTTKHHSVSDIFHRLRPKSLLDFGANRGWYSQLAAHGGARVIAADADEGALCQLYEDTVATGAGNVTTAYLDVRFPEPARGPAYELFKPATERFRSEMVLALAVIHHLVFSGNLSFEQIIRNFCAFCDRWLVIEFVGPSDPAVTAYPSASQRPWYNEEEFLRVLGQYFTVLEVLPSDSAGLHFQDAGPDDRKVLVCELKSRPGH